MNQDQYQQLANQFIELWQQQMQAVMMDKDFIQTMLSGLQQFSTFATNAAHDAKSGKNPAQPAAQSADVLQLLSQLDYRLRMVEQRLSQLEAGQKIKSGTRRPARRSGKPGAASVRKPAKGH